MIVNSGKLSVAFFLAGYLVMVALCFPFWILSLLVGEIGNYCLLVVVVFMVGRGIIRMIAFPGSSSVSILVWSPASSNGPSSSFVCHMCDHLQRVSSEITKEFSKYSVKMIVNSANSLVDLALAISAAGRGEASTASYYDIVQLWNRSKSYRDRVLGVYAEVLNFILNDGQQSTNQQFPELTKYFNNRLSGDIGDLSGLTVSTWMTERTIGNNILDGVLINTLLDSFLHV
jgi:hypothetical protein